MLTVTYEGSIQTAAQDGALINNEKEADVRSNCCDESMNSFRDKLESDLNPILSIKF